MRASAIIKNYKISIRRYILHTKNVISKQSNRITCESLGIPRSKVSQTQAAHVRIVFSRITKNKIGVRFGKGPNFLFVKIVIMRGKQFLCRIDNLKRRAQAVYRHIHVFEIVCGNG